MKSIFSIVRSIIKTRRSVRKFKSNKIDNNLLYAIIEAGIYAPSGSNTQCYRFIVIQDREAIQMLADNKLKWMSSSPCIVLVYADLTACPYLNGNRKSVFDKLPYQDCAMAMQNMCILAESREVSQCVVHLSETWPTAKKIKEYFKLKDTDELMGLVALGYADEEVNYSTTKHAGRDIKRKGLDFYVKWR